MSIISKNSTGSLTTTSPNEISATEPAAPQQNEMPTIDLLGPLMRRKLLIALFSIVGCGLAYYAFTKAKPKYQSSARIMITSQAPPSVGEDGNRAQKFSIARHERLMSSQLVLEAAANEGNFDEMTTFAGGGDVAGALAGVLSLSYSKGEDDRILRIAATGPDENELPVILNQVIKTYMGEIAEDSKATGQEALTLVASLRDQLVKEKKSAEDAYLEILRRLNLPTVEQNGIPFNPYLDELDPIKQRPNGCSNQVKGRLGTNRDRSAGSRFQKQRPSQLLSDRG